MAEDAVKEGTGESLKGLAWLVVGAALGASLLAPMVSSWLGISGELAMILAGMAIAFVGSGAIKKAGQGSAVFGIGLLGASMLGPMLGKITPGDAGGNANASQVAQGSDQGPIYV
jgi:hypothetical protein